MLTGEEIENWKSGPGLLGITGRAGSGKSTAADILVGIGWKRVKMAGPLKDMLRSIGLTDRHIEGDLKEVPCDLLCGQTPRHAMITLGTEWGREIIGGGLWVGLARQRIIQAMSEGYNVVVDDVRFENEADVIRDLGGMVLEVRRSGSISIDHKSEGGVVADMIHDNNGDMSDLRRYMTYVFGMRQEPFE
jgi:energy-coupling factor transporter ATP-binding protein EcfA2